MYPFWVFAILYYDKLSELVKEGSFANLIIFIVFSIVNYLYGQTNVKYYQIIFVCAATIVFINIYAINIQKNSDIDLGYSFHLMEAIMLYMLGFPIVLSAQFFTWFPFLVRFVWQNRKNTHNLKWE